MGVSRIINEGGGTTSSGGGGSSTSLTIENLSSQVDGSNLNFSTGDQFITQTIQVYYNGILQIRGDDYTEDGDREGITFGLAPELNSKVVVIYSIDS